MLERGLWATYPTVEHRLVLLLSMMLIGPAAGKCVRVMRREVRGGGSFLVEVRSYGMWTVPVEGSPAVWSVVSATDTFTGDRRLHGVEPLKHMLYLVKCYYHSSNIIKVYHVAYYMWTLLRLSFYYRVLFCNIVVIYSLFHMYFLIKY